VRVPKRRRNFNRTRRKEFKLLEHGWVRAGDFVIYAGGNDGREEPEIDMKTGTIKITTAEKKGPVRGRKRSRRAVNLDKAGAGTGNS
jgi:hypothetical protein